MGNEYCTNPTLATEHPTQTNIDKTPLIFTDLESKYNEKLQIITELQSKLQNDKYNQPNETKQNSNDELTKQINKLTKQLNIATNKNKEIQTELVNHKKQNKELLNYLGNRYNQIEQEKSQLLESSEKYKIENTEYKQQNSTEIQLPSQRKSITELEETIKDLQHRNSAINAQTETINTFEDELNTIKNINDENVSIELKQRISQLETQLKNTQNANNEEIIQLKLDLKNSKNGYDEMERKLNDLMNEKNELIAMKNVCEKQLSNNTNTMNEQIKRMNKLESQLKETEEINKLKLDLENSKSAYDNIENKYNAENK
eukprot:482698_1